MLTSLQCVYISRFLTGFLQVRMCMTKRCRQGNRQSGVAGSKGRFPQRAMPPCTVFKLVFKAIQSLARTETNTKCHL